MAGVRGAADARAEAALERHSDLAAAWPIVRDADRPDSRLLVDTWHKLKGTTDLAADRELLAAIPGERREPDERAALLRATARSPSTPATHDERADPAPAWTHGNGRSVRRPRGARHHDALQRPEHHHARRRPSPGAPYCLAHHLRTEDRHRTLTVIAIRYLDTFAHAPDAWRFASCTLVLDWTDERPSIPQADARASAPRAATRATSRNTRRALSGVGVRTWRRRGER